MKGCIVALLSLVSAVLIASAPALASTTTAGIPSGEHQCEQLVFEDQTRLRVTVDVTSGSQVTLLLLDEADFLLFQQNKTYQALHKSTTMDHLTVTVDVGAGTWFVVFENRGADEVQLSTDISWESGRGGGEIYVSPVLLVLLAVAVAAVAVLFYASKKRK